jgi:thiamine transporter ThiT
MSRKSTPILVECAMMIAMSTALSFVKLFDLPQGGSVTCASMAPLILVSYRHGIKWGLFTGFVHSLLQMLIQFYAQPANTALAFAGTILLGLCPSLYGFGRGGLFWKPLQKQACKRRGRQRCRNSLKVPLQLYVWHTYLGKLRSRGDARMALFPYLQRQLHASGDNNNGAGLGLIDSVLDRLRFEK